MQYRLHGCSPKHYTEATPPVHPGNSRSYGLIGDFSNACYLGVAEMTVLPGSTSALPVPGVAYATFQVHLHYTPTTHLLHTYYTPTTHLLHTYYTPITQSCV